MPALSASKGWWERYGGIAALALASLALASGGLFLLLRGQSNPAIEIALPLPTPAPQWKVYITGAVATPGLYELRGDVTLDGALRAAGGVTQESELARVQVHVPSAGLVSGGSLDGEPSGPPPLPTFLPDPAKTNINTASAQELADRLTGIGPVLAERIVQYRKTYGPFRRIEDVLDVQGIGPGILEKIQDSISVGP